MRVSVKKIIASDKYGGAFEKQGTNKQKILMQREDHYKENIAKRKESFLGKEKPKDIQKGVIIGYCLVLHEIYMQLL